MPDGTATTRRITRSYTMAIAAPPDAAFPFLCPRREHEYLPDWKAEILFSESGFAEPGCIFTTRRPGDDAETVWVVTDHDPRKRIVKFVMVTPGSRVGRLTVRCEAMDNAPGSCAVTFTYEVTAISEAGQRYLDEQFTEEQFVAHMRGEERAWNHFLKTGTMLRG